MALFLAIAPSLLSGTERYPVSMARTSFRDRHLSPKVPPVELIVSQNMSESNSIRAELEAIYNRVREAFDNEDIDAVLSLFKHSGGEDPDRAELEANWEMSSEIMSEPFIPLEDTVFIKLEEKGDKVGYFYRLKEMEDIVQVQRIVFWKKDGKWVVASDLFATSSASTFPGEEEEAITEALESPILEMA